MCLVFMVMLYVFFGGTAGVNGLLVVPHVFLAALEENLLTGSLKHLIKHVVLI